MSLRIRLTLLYITLVGGILSIFGVAIYGSVRFTLLNQVDETLERTALDIIENMYANDLGVLSIVQLPALDLPTDLYVQVWGIDNELKESSPNIREFTSPLDPGGLESLIPIYRNVVTANVPLRVLTVPLMVGERSLGVLQVGSIIAVIEATQRTLLSVLIVGTLIAICVAGLAGWFTTNRALSPLEDVTQTALQITRADDLSHRIPYHGSPNDEVGQLINAFNQTLSRLESLFHTQRRFMADVGHELRTPLTVIKGNVGLMRRMGQTDEESLAGIENEVDRLTRLVGDLLLLAQAESGKLPLDKRLVELDTLLLEVMQQVRVLARDRLQLKLGEIDQILVCGDKDRLKQVMVNLIGNAISYTPLGGEIIVGVGKSDNLARLTISDTGPGIPAEDLPHIFERFYRAEKSRTRSKDGKGFGLGLSIAYWIVNNHGGKIEVNSKVGEGTTFCVWLPLADGNCTEET
jgi:two-component system, OmpR family, sensor kinase